MEEETIWVINRGTHVHKAEDEQWYIGLVPVHFTVQNLQC